MTETKKKRNHFDKILFIILLVLVAIFVRQYIVEKDAEPAAKPTEKIDLTDVQKDISLEGRELKVEVLHHKGCEQCFQTNTVLAYLNSLGLDLLIDERYVQDSEEDQELIKELGVSKLPVIILRKDNEGLEYALELFEKRDDTLVLEAPQPPYYYIPTEKIIGYVTVYYLKDPSCTLCPKIGELVHDMQWDMGVGFLEKKAIYPNMTEFNELVEKYNIEKIPTYIFTGDLLEYEFIKKSWDKVGTIEPDGSLVLRLVNPPYINPQTGEMEGIVDVTFLVDTECEDECVDAPKMAETLKNAYNIVYGKSKTVDISSGEGKVLLDKYGLSGEAIIMSEDALLYPGVMDEWNKTESTWIAEDNALIWALIKE